MSLNPKHTSRPRMNEKVILCNPLAVSLDVPHESAPRVKKIFRQNPLKSFKIPVSTIPTIHQYQNISIKPAIHQSFVETLKSETNTINMSKNDSPYQSEPQTLTSDQFSITNESSTNEPVSRMNSLDIQNKTFKRNQKHPKRMCGRCTRVYLFLLPCTLILVGAVIATILMTFIKTSERTSTITTTATTATTTTVTTETTTTVTTATTTAVNTEITTIVTTETATIVNTETATTVNTETTTIVTTETATIVNTETATTVNTETTTTATTATTTTVTTATTTTTTTRTTTTTTTTITTTTTTPVRPIAVSSITTFCGCKNFTLSLTGITFSTVGVTYQWQSSTTVMNVWSNITAPSTSNTSAIGTQLNSTDYQCIIISSGPPLLVFPSTAVTVTNAFCAPSVLTYGCGSSDTINNFILVGESNTQINDVSTGCAANNYDNRTSESVTLFANKVYTALISTQYAGDLLKIWIDFNNNFVFETSELVSTQTMSTTSNIQTTLTIPAISSAVTVGVHRMRASLSYSITPNPCGPPAIYGEMQDYSVNIIAYASGSTTYSQSFTSGSTPSAQCTAWTSFIALLPLRAYTSMNIRGSVDPVGVTLTDPTTIFNIVLALRTSTAYGPVTFNSRSWAVGVCGSGYELSSNGAVCTCSTGYDIRPCVSNANWGGINGASCSGATQTMIVTFYY